MASAPIQSDRERDTGRGIPPKYIEGDEENPIRLAFRDDRVKDDDAFVMPEE